MVYDDEAERRARRERDWQYANVMQDDAGYWLGRFMLAAPFILMFAHRPSLGRFLRADSSADAIWAALSLWPSLALGASCGWLFSFLMFKGLHAAYRKIRPVR